MALSRFAGLCIPYVSFAQMWFYKAEVVNREQFL
jgi:hypothetical protein